jgi:hypothetical protein
MVSEHDSLFSVGVFPALLRGSSGLKFYLFDNNKQYLALTTICYSGRKTAGWG